MVEGTGNDDRQKFSFSWIASILLTLIGLMSLVLSIQMMNDQKVRMNEGVAALFTIAAAISFGFLRISSNRR